MANDYNWSYLSGLQNSGANECLLAVFVGCGIVKNPDYGGGSDLLSEVCGRLGADSGVAFGTTSVLVTWGNKFMEVFWSDLEAGQTIGYAAKEANDAAQSIGFGVIYTTEAVDDEQIVVRNPSLKIKPARWGSP